MGRLHDAAAEWMRAASIEYFTRAIPAGEYSAWLATPAGDPGQVIAGAGIQRRAILPSPDASGAGVVTELGLILNVYTESAWRRRGIAEQLMRVVLDWATAHGLERIVLHASEAGRPMYEKLGFQTSNEMRYRGPAR